MEQDVSKAAQTDGEFVAIRRMLTLSLEGALPRCLRHAHPLLYTYFLFCRALGFQQHRQRATNHRDTRST